MKKNTASRLFVMPTLLASAIAFSNAAVASDWSVDFVNTISYGAMWRMEDPNKEAIVPKGYADLGSPDPTSPGYNPLFFYDSAQAVRAANGNDGNQNFEKGDMVQNRISIISDLNINYKNFGAFVRARAWYDDIYKNQDPASWTPVAQGDPAYPLGDFNGDQMGQFQSETKDYLGSEIELLDAYLFANFKVFGKHSSVRVGKQVINWGESMAFPNSVSSAINPVDANAGTRAGVDLKEIFQPTESLYGQIGLTSKITMEAFYQWKHRGTTLLAAGSYFSEQDMLGVGADEMIILSINNYVLNDKRDEVEDGGQYGLAFRYFADSGTEYGFYAVNAHDKTPSLETERTNATLKLNGTTFQVEQQPGTGLYHVDYKEDLQTFGLSFSTVWGDTNVTGELSYRPNATIVLDPACVAYTLDTSAVGGPTMAPVNPADPSDPNNGCSDHLPSEISEAKLAQMQMSFVHVYGHSAIWDSLSIAGEVVAWQYGELATGEDAEDDNMYFTNTPNGLGTLLRVDFNYTNLFFGADLNIPITWQQGWKGTNFRTNSREGATVFSAGTRLIFPADWETSLIYTMYAGEDDDQLDATFYHLADRDNIAFNVKYNF